MLPPVKADVIQVHSMAVTGVAKARKFLTTWRLNAVPRSLKIKQEPQLAIY
jgi:hypothetical protein